jgi:hypothetical protein
MSSLSERVPGCIIDIREALDLRLYQLKTLGTWNCITIRIIFTGRNDDQGLVPSTFREWKQSEF